MPRLYTPVLSKASLLIPRKSRTRGKARFINLSRKLYILSPRNVTITPTGLPLRNLKLEISLRAFTTTAFWQVMSDNSFTMTSTLCLSPLTSPIPRFTVTLTRRGTDMIFLRPSFSFNEGRIFSKNLFHKGTYTLTSLSKSLKRTLQLSPILSIICSSLYLYSFF